MIGRALEGLAGDVRRGLDAPARPLMLGALGALGISTPLIVGLALAIGAGPAAAAGAAVQLVAGYALAGRMTRSG